MSFDEAELNNALKSTSLLYDITKYIVSANNNYLRTVDLDTVGYFNLRSGTFQVNSNFKCGYIKYPRPGTYQIYQPQNVFGTNYPYVPLFDSNRKYVKSLLGTSSDNKVVSFSITEDDAKVAPIVGISWKIDDIRPMLVLDSEYPPNYKFKEPEYTSYDLKSLRYMYPNTKDLNEIIDSGWYSNIGTTPRSEWSNLPEGLNSIGSLFVFTDALNATYTIQILIDAEVDPNIWYRYLNKGTHQGSTWVQLHVKGEKSKLNNILNTYILDKDNIQISLNGNYFDYKNAEWLDGYTAGSNIVQAEGFHYAYVKLLGPGNYIRVMNYSRFGSNATLVPLYDQDKVWVKTVTATRIGTTNGFSFTLTENDVSIAKYTAVNYKEGYEYYAALLYESTNWPMKAGDQPDLPKYGFIDNSIYQSTFICDGDSIGQGSQDIPKNLKGWWGRFAADYSIEGKNYSVGGGTITTELYYENSTPRHWISSNIDTIHQEYPELDYLILEGGTNDADLIGRFNEDTPPERFGSYDLNDFSGNYDNTTFCGAVEYLFYKAITYYPRSKIGFIIAMQMGRNSSSQANRRRYFDTIKDIANKWHIPVLDLWNSSQMDSRLDVYYDPNLSGPENVQAKKCYYDGQHPTSYGYDLIQTKIDSWVNSL